ncbi:MAG: hypothetical protein DWQ34_10170 [Planctomycetota bacterium]|nr:MAG: hypothetical protein DWQ29_05420 [Planctomycetota bacterium]REJ93589.1 MAG: hypothetical protein DWQ34_10170 [Planctomycetota bacterium]REK19952.1 MAG: hypothetical protein DWQ41_26870 [Planctomycetota bacterium]REK27518.1 MAG: hypothetical protein DWQ45_25890 [Planctomycetota bacterium]
MWAEISRAMRPADLLDIALVACLLYVALAWLRRRGTYSAVALVAAVLIIYQASQWLNLYLTLALFQVGMTALLLGFLIVYQEDVRAGIERLMSRRSWKAVGGEREESLIGSLIEALAKMAQAKTGALIVLQGREPIGRHVNGGVLLRGRVSVPLLLSLFNRKSPAHDGAVIILGDKIERFAAHLPLTGDLDELGERGTRHAAALGLSERCDALVFAVSEERGTIAVAEHGRLRELSSATECRTLYAQFVDDRDLAERRSWSKVVSVKEWATAGVAVIVSVILWMPFATRSVEVVQQTLDIPLAFAGAPEGWMVSRPSSQTVEVTLSGSPNAFSLLNPEKIRQSVQLPPPGGRKYVFVDPEDLDGLPEGLTVVEVRPQYIRVGMERQPTGETAAPEDGKN